MELLSELVVLAAQNASADALAANGSSLALSKTSLGVNASAPSNHSLPAAGQANATQHNTETDLGSSFLLDAGIVAVGLSLWKVMRIFRLNGPPLSRRGDEPSLCNSRGALQSTVARNYVCFLQHCRDLFVVMTIISAASTLAYWGMAPYAVGSQQVSTIKDLKPTGLVILCFDTALRGLVALAFVERLQRRIQNPILTKAATDSIQRTLWLRDLPVYDRETWEAFEFKDEDFQRVAEDLELAINTFLDKRRTREQLPTTKGSMKVHVAPVVDKWYDVSLKMRTALERAAVYDSLQDVEPTSCCTWLAMHWYARQYRLQQNQVEKLERELTSIVKGPKRISGTAFITFQSSKLRDHFLTNKPRFWQCWGREYFKFGRPPFASATLAVSRAPHPDDVNWTNLHVKRIEQRGWLTILTVLLFIFMVSVVTPVAIGSQLEYILDWVKKKFGAEAGTGIMRVFKSGWVAKLSVQLAALFLVLINSLLLPEIIYRIAVASKPHRKSSVEVIQLHLNAIFLILNSLVIPFLEVSSLHAVMRYAEDKMGRHMVRNLKDQFTENLMHSPGVFALRYIVNCACITNMNSLLQIPQLASRACARRAARTARESVDAEEAWIFAWGYWYAWTISIFTIAILMSTAVPSVLPCAALFFTLQHTVDRYNLTYRIYQHGPDIETENLLATRVLHYMRCIIAIWWGLMGVGFWMTLQTNLVHVWDSAVPVEGVYGVSIGLSLLAVFLVLFSWWMQQKIIHDNQFQNVNISERGLASTGVLEPLFRGIEDFARCSCCVRGRGRYSSINGPRRDTPDITDLELECASPLDERHGEADEANDLSWDAKQVVIEPVENCSPL